MSIAVAAWILWGPAIRRIVAPRGDIRATLEENFRAPTVPPPGRVEVTGFYFCGEGWCLGPRAWGSLTYHVVAQDEYPFLNLWLFPTPGGTTRVSVSVDGGRHYRTVSENAPYTRAMSPVDLGVRVQRGQALAIRFDATNPGQDAFLVLDKCTVVYRDTHAPELPARTVAFWLVISFGLAVVVLCRRPGEALATMLILAYGAYLRYWAAIDLADMPLEPDAIGYRAYADLMALFTDTGFFSGRFGTREPLFVFVAHVYYELFGSSDFGLRVLTVTLSVAAIWAVIRMGRALFGYIPGQLIGLAMAVHMPLAFEAARALRLELEIVLAMAYFGFGFVTRWRRVLPAALVLASLGALLVATRMTYLPVVLGLNAYALYMAGRLKWLIPGMAVSVAVLAAVVGLHRYGLYRVNNDAFYDMSVYARWNANIEFVGRPGFPSADDLPKDYLAGPPLTYREYMLGLHTRTEVIVGTVRGYLKLFGHMVVAPWRFIDDPRWRLIIDRVFQALAALGFVLALWMRKYRWMPLAFVLFEFPVAFVYDRGLVETYRHSYSAYPLVLFAATLPMVTLWSWGLQRRQRPAPAQAGGIAVQQDGGG